GIARWLQTASREASADVTPAVTQPFEAEAHTTARVAGDQTVEPARRLPAEFLLETIYSQPPWFGFVLENSAPIVMGGAVLAEIQHAAPVQPAVRTADQCPVFRVLHAEQRCAAMQENRLASDYVAVADQGIAPPPHG